jgi:hypothetical protein
MEMPQKNGLLPLQKAVERTAGALGRSVSTVQNMSKGCEKAERSGIKFQLQEMSSHIARN